MDTHKHTELSAVLGRLETTVRECRVLAEGRSSLTPTQSIEWCNGVDQWEALIDVLRYELEASLVSDAVTHQQE